MPCPLCESVRLAESGGHAGLVAAFAHCVVLLGENQGCPGWCVLVLRRHVEHMDELGVDEQREVFAEVARVARAIRRVLPREGKDGGAVRINYECLGNVEPHVHWHVIPRHADDPTPRSPVWGWSAGVLRGTMTAEERGVMVGRLQAEMG